MSSRLGRALAKHILGLPGDRKFVAVEGVEEDLAVAMADAWDGAGLPLAIASAHPERFGRQALAGESGTALRNRGPVCLVVCEGFQLPDRQSLRAFESVAPGDLLASHEGLALLARQPPEAPMDGPVRPVRGAIIQAGAAARPSASAVASYLDRCAAGEPPLQALPALGAFADHAAGGAVDERRVLENFKLAMRRRSEQPRRPADVRRRAQRVLARRPGLSPEDATRLAERTVVLLQTGDDELLSLLTYDEASEILEEKTSDLSVAVLRDLRDYRSARESEDISWGRYEDAARQLRDVDQQRPAARDLLNFDEVEGGRVFDSRTTRRLQQLLKERVLSASQPSCPEFALLRAATALAGIGAIELIAPIRTARQQHNRTSAGQEIVLACARLRIGQTFRILEEEYGVEIDGALLRRADDALWPEIFEDAQIGTGPPLTTLQLRIRSRDDSDSRLISWRPDLDDIAALRAAIAFSEQPALSVRFHQTPTLESFCSGPPPEPEAVPAALAHLAANLQHLAADTLEHGLNPEPLGAWALRWEQAVRAEQAGGRAQHAEALALAGAAVSDSACALTALAPLKAEWLGQYLDGLWSMLWLVQGSEGERPFEPGEETGVGIARSTAAHYPAHMRLRARDRALLPTGEGRIWSVYGADAPDNGHLAGEAIEAVIERLVTLQPDAAGHLRCIAYGPGAATLLVEQAIALVSPPRRIGRAVLRKIELFCIEEEGWKPSPDVLARADEEFAGQSDRPLELRYLASLAAARDLLPRAPGAPAVHLALVTGLSGGGARLTVDSTPIDPPPADTEVLFAPRTWSRPRATRRMLLAPPGATGPGRMWLRLMNAVEDDEWPERDSPIRVPELRTASGEWREQLLALHELALWVATLDPYASRDSLTYAMGDEVAILHQDRRLGGDSPLSLVISQQSGGPVDRAVGRSLRSAGIVADFRRAQEIGESLRKVASEGYGVLALQAATTGAGINELVGHVVAFSLLATHTTPWPLPPDCRVLLVSLDDYQHWFPAKRADLLVFALDTAEDGVHVAAIEVKARRSDADLAARDALDQLRQTLHATRFAAYPQRGLVHSRLWLNRLAEAACAVARESNFRLDQAELAALDRFRRGDGTLEWAGLGLVFGPGQSDINRHYHYQVEGDRIPIVVHSVRLTEELLSSAAGVRLPKLRTVQAELPPLEGGRTRRRPERPAPGAEPRRQDRIETEPRRPAVTEEPQEESETPGQSAERIDVVEPIPEAGTADLPGGPAEEPLPAFQPPVLGWDASSGEPLLWRAAGEDAELDNGHTEIWGASGAGKTQFTMALLAQLARHSDARFGVADFKNDYSNNSSDHFPDRVGARFLDLWNDGAPFNPLALADGSQRDISRAIIELRDIVDVAAQSFTRMGHRQVTKLERALERSYEVGRAEGRWPTLLTLNDQLDEDLLGVIGDLTRHEIFRDGPPLGDAIEERLVFGLYEIPGNGLTTVLAAGFILSALHLKIQSLPQVANTIRYLTVVDEAHRVAAFKAVKSMLREGRSKGLAVILATQQPGDLPDEVATNANTRICFRLPDATIAAAAARRLDMGDRSLPEQIRTLDRGEAFVSLAGSAPLLVNMAQFYREDDRRTLGLEP
jgi:hypothetical protein